MNKTEWRILQKLATAIVHSNRVAWDQLKWEIYDYGYQSNYPAQSFFENTAREVLKHLSDFEQRKLIQLWNNSSPKRANLSDDEIHDRNAQMILEQIMARARSAAYRTINW